MPKQQQLTTLANPPRTFDLRGQTITWLPLTLRDLAEIESRHGNLSEFFSRALQGEITPILTILTKAIQKANPNLNEDNIGDRFLAGDLIGDNAPAAQLLHDILEASGLTLEQNEKKE